MIALDERSWLCSGPEIWSNQFFHELKSESGAMGESTTPVTPKGVGGYGSIKCND